jgi:hypothetical protein
MNEAMNSRAIMSVAGFELDPENHALTCNDVVIASTSDDAERLSLSRESSTRAV